MGKAKRVKRYQKKTQRRIDYTGGASIARTHKEFISIYGTKDGSALWKASGVFATATDEFLRLADGSGWVPLADEGGERVFFAVPRSL